MRKLTAALAIAIAIPTSLTAQTPATTSPPQWRVLLEKATFARTYEGDPDASKKLFASALAAAKASGDPDAEQAVLRTQNRQQPQQDPRARRVVERLLDSVLKTPIDQRQRAIGRIDWQFYAADTGLVPWLCRCLDGPARPFNKMIELRPEDVLMINNYLDAPQQIPVLEAALANEDLFVRGLGLRACDRDDHRDLLVRALTDTNRIIRETACSELDTAKTEAEVLAVLRAIELQTERAIEMVSHRPEFLSAMRQAAPSSWLAQTLLEQQPSLTTTKWTASDTAKVRILLEWSRITANTPDAPQWLVAAADELGSGRTQPTYPDALARDVLQQALAEAQLFDADRPANERANLGRIVKALGGLAELKQLAKAWMLDPNRGDEDCQYLYDLCYSVGVDGSKELVALGQTLLEEAEAAPEYAGAADRCRAYWTRLARRRWTAAEAGTLAQALSFASSRTGQLRQLVYPSSVLSVRTASASKEIAAMVRQHLVRIVLEELVVPSRRVEIVTMLVDAGDPRAPELACSVGKHWSTKSREAYGDFLRRACRNAGDRGRVAVLAALRAGMTEPPTVLDGELMREANWPGPVIPRYAGGLGLAPAAPRIVPQPKGQIVVKQEKTYSRLPSLLCVLPVEQAAQAAAELWQDDQCPIPKTELIETLLMAQSVPLALDTLVVAYEQIEQPETKARLLRVFGELVHEPARRLIAHSLYSKQPLVRYEGLQAAQMLLAYDRARTDLSASLPADQRPSNGPNRQAR